MINAMANRTGGSFPLTGEPDYVAHPGVFLGDELEEREMTQRELAALMGRPQQLVSEIVRGKRAITPETALQLERALDIRAAMWMSLQSAYDLHLARQKQSA
jgi:HTH-type transcriptional regulator / antitoxin HigA